jgi:hypothetical protein
MVPNVEEVLEVSITKFVSRKMLVKQIRSNLDRCQVIVLLLCKDVGKY